MNDINANTIGQVFQDIINEFSNMNPAKLNILENKVLDSIYKLGSLLMEWKLSDWNDELKNDTCPKCNTKLENRKRQRQIATMVSDVNFTRYMSHCPKCKKTEYPLDRNLGLHPRQRMSSQVEELSALCGASWSYEKSEYLLKKILHRYCVSHNTIHELTNCIGEEASKETEGNKIKELESDKLSQGDYFENMELVAQPQVRIYADMDGVMINSRDNLRRMEGKVAMVWSERELSKKDTYAITDKRYMGSFTDSGVLSWEIVSELYKRSGGNLDCIECLIRGDGAPWIRGFREEHMPKGRYILDYYHLCKKVKERLWMVYKDKERRKSSIQAIMNHLDAGEVDKALEFIGNIRKRIRNELKLKALDRLSGYIERNREGIWYKEAKEEGISIGSGTADKAGDILICRRMKLRGMRWCRLGADSVLNIRILVANNEWDQFWSNHKAA